MLSGSAFGSSGFEMTVNTMYMNRVSETTTQIVAAAMWRMGAASIQLTRSDFGQIRTTNRTTAMSWVSR